MKPEAPIVVHYDPADSYLIRSTCNRPARNGWKSRTASARPVSFVCLAAANATRQAINQGFCEGQTGRVAESARRPLFSSRHQECCQQTQPPARSAAIQSKKHSWDGEAKAVLIAIVMQTMKLSCRQRANLGCTRTSGWAAGYANHLGLACWACF